MSQQRKPDLFDFIIERPRLSIITGLLLILMGLLISDLLKMAATLGWPATSGTITSLQTQKKRFREYDGDFYEEIQVHLRYEYTVNGITYTSGAVNAINLPFYPPEIAEKYPEKEDVTVYYSPKDPAKAVLERGFVNVFKAFDVFSFIFFAAAIYFIRAGSLERKKREWRATFQEKYRQSNLE